VPAGSWMISNHGIQRSMTELIKNRIYKCCRYLYVYKFNDTEHNLMPHNNNYNLGRLRVVKIIRPMYKYYDEFWYQYKVQIIFKGKIQNANLYVFRDTKFKLVK
jgi:hypothetical protein